MAQKSQSHPSPLPSSSPLPRVRLYADGRYFHDVLWRSVFPCPFPSSPSFDSFSLTKIRWIVFFDIYCRQFNFSFHFWFGRTACAYSHFKTLRSFRIMPRQVKLCVHINTSKFRYRDEKNTIKPHSSEKSNVILWNVCFEMIISCWRKKFKCIPLTLSLLQS